MGFFANFIPRNFAADGTTLALTGNTFSIKALGVDSAKIAASAVSYAKLAADALPMGRLVSTTTLVGASNTISLASLDINTDGRYLLDISHISPAAETVSLYANADNTAAHYYSQFYTANNATINASRVNLPEVFYAQAAQTSSYKIDVNLDNGYFTFKVPPSIDRVTSAIVQWSAVGAKTDATIANLTQLDLVTSGANGFSIGTVVSLYKLRK